MRLRREPITKLEYLQQFNLAFEAACISQHKYQLAKMKFLAKASNNISLQRLSKMDEQIQKLMIDLGTQLRDAKTIVDSLDSEDLSSTLAPNLLSEIKVNSEIVKSLCYSAIIYMDGEEITNPNNTNTTQPNQKPTPTKMSNLLNSLTKIAVVGLPILVSHYKESDSTLISHPLLQSALPYLLATASCVVIIVALKSLFDGNLAADIDKKVTSDDLLTTALKTAIGK